MLTLSQGESPRQSRTSVAPHQAEPDAGRRARRADRGGPRGPGRGPGEESTPSQAGEEMWVRSAQGGATAPPAVNESAENASNEAGAAGPWKDREQGFSRPVRRGLYRLRDGLRGYQPSDRVEDCGHRRIRHGAIAIAVRGERAHFDGILRCGSVWACPVCGSHIRGERARQVEQLVEWAGSSRVFLLSLTVRHGLGDDPRRLREGVSAAWKGFVQGKGWIGLKERARITGWVRALEVTHGAHGWHPHLHLLVATDDPKALADLRDTISARWQSVVARVLGEDHRPDDAHGCDLRPCHQARYIAKMGLEIADPSATKKGRKGSRTPFEIGSDAVRDGKAKDVQLWRDYCGAFHGARQLNWSGGLRERAGISDKSDEEIVEGDGTDVALVEISHSDWITVRSVPEGPLRLLEAVEAAMRAKKDPLAAVEAELRELAAYWDRASEWGEVPLEVDAS